MPPVRSTVESWLCAPSETRSNRRSFLFNPEKREIAKDGLVLRILKSSQGRYKKELEVQRLDHECFEFRSA